MPLPNSRNYDLSGLNEAYFWSRLTKGRGGCLCWGGLLANGYGQIKVNKRRLYAHRVAWTLKRGPVPDGLVLCHSCDTRSCCNVKHLFAGTFADNNRDARLKGRHRVVVGVLRPNARLTDAIVTSIRNRNARGETMRELATCFDVSMGAIQHVVQGRTWRHLPVAQGRRRKATLTVKQLRRVRKLLDAGETHRSIAERFNVSRSWITLIASGAPHAVKPR